MKRSVYRHADLRRVIEPSRIAIVGASSKPSGFGSRTRACLSQFKGQVMLVNPRHDRIGDDPCYPSLRDLPAVPDCVVIAAPKEDVEGVLLECAHVGAGGAIVFASGFAEIGRPEAIATQNRLTAIARETGLRILGPNSVGIANFMQRAVMMFFAVPVIDTGSAARIGLISQTGSLGIALCQATQTGTSFSHLLGSGNSCDVDIADFIAYLAEDAHCKAIACLFEGLQDPRRLIEAGEIARRQGKPLLVHKIAIGQAGGRAAQSHTGVLAGSNEVYRAAFERIGAVIVDEMDGLVEAAAFFAKMNAPPAPGVAAVSGSGGATVIAADKAEKYRVPMPQPSPRVAAILREHIPDFGAAGNPCDVTAQASNNPESLVACINALISDEQYGAVITTVVPNARSVQVAMARAAQIGELGIRHGKAVCVVSISQWLDGPNMKEVEMNPHVALFRSLDRCYATLAAWNARHAALQHPEVREERLSPQGAAAEARRILSSSAAATLTERESKQVLAAYGIPVTEGRLAESADEAVRYADELHYPVALKIESPDLPHKTDAGGVQLNVNDAAGVRAAYQTIIEAVRRSAPDSRLHGVRVEPMIAKGVELLVGAHRDALFGPVVVAGAGGVLVELLHDTAVMLPPVSLQQGRTIWNRLRLAPLLQGFRGAKPVNLDAVAEVVRRISELALDLEDALLSVDVNPLVCADGCVVAVDASLIKCTQNQ